LKILDANFAGVETIAGEPPQEGEEDYSLA
jgi:hypothetical protein